MTISFRLACNSACTARLGGCRADQVAPAAGSGRQQQRKSERAGHHGEGGRDMLVGDIAHRLTTQIGGSCAIKVKIDGAVGMPAEGRWFGHSALLEDGPPADSAAPCSLGARDALKRA